MIEVLPKPPGCADCPLSESGHGFVPDTAGGGKDAGVTLWLPWPDKYDVSGQRAIGWGDTFESVTPAPAIGKAGTMMRSALWPRARVTAPGIAHTIRCCPPVAMVATEKKVQAHWGVLRRAAAQCAQYHEHLTPANVALGRLPLWHATGGALGTADDLQEWRGWVHPWARPTPTEIYQPGGGWEYTFISYEPRRVWSQPDTRPLVAMDWDRLGKLLAGTWPERLPDPRPFGDVDPLFPCAYDTEYDPRTRIMSQWSWAQPTRDGDMIVGEGPGPVPYLEHPVGHNLPVDWPYLPRAPRDWDDTMYMHAILYAGFPHDLGYLGSFWARTNRWKHLFNRNRREYSAADALGTWDAYTALRRQFTREDPEAWNLYRRTMVPLVPVEVARQPLTVRQDVVTRVLARMKEEQTSLRAEAQAVAGWPIKVSSPQQVERVLRV